MGAGDCERETGALFPYGSHAWTTGRRCLSASTRVALPPSFDPYYIVARSAW